MDRLCWAGAAKRTTRASWREGDEGPGFVQLEPAAVDREFEARAVFGRAAVIAKQKRLRDFLDVDAALNRLDRVGDFEDSASGFFRVGIGAGGGEFHAAALSSLSTPR